MSGRVSPSRNIPERVRAIDGAFCTQLLAHRRAAKMSRAVLARRSGISVLVIQSMEVGKSVSAGKRQPRRRPSLGEAIALAEALGVKVGDLLRRGAR